MKRCLAVLVGCSLLASSVGRTLGADSDSEKEKLQGTWKSISYQYLDANGATIDLKDGATLTFDDEFVDLKLRTGVSTRNYLDLDVDESPKHIDLTEMRRNYKDPDRANKGIYLLNGDELTVCFGGSVRPTKFELRPKNGDAVIKLKRQPK